MGKTVMDMMHEAVSLPQSLGALRARPGIVAALVMRTWAGMKVRERPSNRGRWVDAIVSIGGGTPSNASAWCMYAAWAAWHSACFSLGMQLTSRTSGGVLSSWHHAKGTVSQISIDAVRSGEMTIQAGDIFIRTRDADQVARAIAGSKPVGHAEIVLSPQRKDGWIHTAGGNTNMAGSREGDGVYEKHEGIHLDDPRLVGFLRPVVRPLIVTG